MTILDSSTTGLGSEHEGQKHRIKHVAAGVSVDSSSHEEEGDGCGSVVSVGTVSARSEPLT